jgi:hypothetical protein
MFGAQLDDPMPQGATRLALMHGPTFVGNGAAQLLALADCFDAQLEPAA